MPRGSRQTSGRKSAILPLPTTLCTIFRRRAPYRFVSCAAQGKPQDVSSQSFLCLRPYVPSVGAGRLTDFSHARPKANLRTLDRNPSLANDLMYHLQAQGALKICFMLLCVSRRTLGRDSALLSCYAYMFSLCRRGVVATTDLSAENLDFLSSDDWLTDRRNVIQLRLVEQAY